MDEGANRAIHRKCKPTVDRPQFSLKTKGRMRILVGNVYGRFVLDDGNTPPPKTDYVQAGIVPADVYEHFTHKSDDAYHQQQAVARSGKPKHVVDQIGFSHFIAKDSGRFGVGILNEVRKFLDGKKYFYTVNDLRAKLVPTIPVQKNLLPNVTLYDFQVDALHAIVEHQNCLIGIPTGGGKCVAGETLVWIRDKKGERCVEISSLFPDDFKEEEWRIPENLEVLSINGWRKVTKIYKTNQRVIKRITFDDGTVLRGVEEHRLATNDGDWTFLCDLDVSKSVASLSEDKYEWRKGAVKLQCTNFQDEKDQKSAIKSGLNRNASQFNADMGTSHHFCGQLNSSANAANRQCSFLKQSNETIVLATDLFAGIVLQRNPENGVKKKEEKHLRNDTENRQAWLRQMQKNVIEKRAWKDTVLITISKLRNLWTGIQIQNKELLNAKQLKKYMEILLPLNRLWKSFVRQWLKKMIPNGLLSVIKNKGLGNKKMPMNWKEFAFVKNVLNADIFRQDSANFMFTTGMAILKKAWLGFLKVIQELNPFCVGQSYAMLAGNTITISSTLKFVPSTEHGFFWKLKRRGLLREPEILNLKKEQQSNTQKAMDILDTSFLCCSNELPWQEVASNSLKKSWKRPVQITTEPFLENCYDLQVEGEHCYWTNGVLSHNTLDLASLSVVFGKSRLLYLMDKVTLTRQTARRFLGYGIAEDEICTVTGNTYSADSLSPYTWNEVAIKKSRIVLCIQQMAEAALAKEWEKFDGVIVDESHHARAKGLTAMLKKTKHARLRVGMSGTVQSGDVIDDLRRRAYLGPVVYFIPTKELVDRGILTKPVITFIGVTRKDTKMWASSSWQEVYENGIALFHKRNNIAADLAKRMNGRTLVLFRLLAHGRELMKRFNVCPPPDQPVPIYTKGFKPLYYLDGGVDAPTRDKVIDAFGKETHAVLVASTIFDEGIDLPGIENLIICTGEKSFVKQIQRLGRALRPNTQNLVFAFDFFDWSHATLIAHSEERMRIWTEEGHEIKRIELTDQ